MNMKFGEAPIQILKDFFHQKSPDKEREMPEYYAKTLALNNQFLGLDMFLILLLSFVFFHHIHLLPVVLFLILNVKIFYAGRMTMKVNLLLHTVVTIAWTGWYIWTFGWGSGGQHFLLCVVLLNFFAIYISPAMKVIYFFLLIIVRMLFYAYTLQNAPVLPLSSGFNVMFQTINSIVLFFSIAGSCIILSTNIQQAERKLLIANEELHKEAETDVLTGLPNRRSMIVEMQQFILENPKEQYCIAIADIDLFKRVNDTYGHNCGDYTLKTIAECFMKREENYLVCRWGGEEFCFFFPRMNLDDAGLLMRNISIDVRELKLEFEEARFGITITAGVQENDFHSSLDKIIEEADEKLYIGKNSGRNCVIV